MKKLSLKEKCELLVAESTFKTKGIDDNLFAIKVSDGPVGVRHPSNQYPLGNPVAYCLPSISLVASTFNPHVAYDLGRCLASQCVENDIDIILGPGMNIKRTPLCGRNFEYFSEDPYLTGIQATSYVNGIQSLGIGSCVKHFCCNNHEYDRLFVSSEVDYRTIREIYTKAFEMVIKDASPYAVMDSYNAINGINVSENKFVLEHILRNKIGYDDLLISDWGAVKNRVSALKATLDIEFPENPSSITKLYEACLDGNINKKEIDNSIERILKTCKRINDNRHLRKILPQNEVEDICLNAIAEGSVLLKNNDDILPLKVKNVALLGGMVNEPSYCGGGSATIFLKDKIPSLLNELEKVLPDANISYSMMYNNHVCAKNNEVLGLPTFSNIKFSLELAYDSDVTIMVVGTNSVIEVEAADRTTLKLNPQIEELIKEVSLKNNNLVVIIESGSVLDISAWESYAKAILYVNFAGSYCNMAIAELLAGKRYPSGRLNETMPYNLLDNPTNISRGNGYVDNYFEKNMVGYRYYFTNNIKPLYPFGYGLTYAKFKYENLDLVKLDNDNYTLKLDIINDSNIEGMDVLQIYSYQVDSLVLKPTRELIKFEKVKVKSQETKHLEISLNRKDFNYFNVLIDDFDVLPGRYEIMLTSNNVEDIAKFKIKL